MFAANDWKVRDGQVIIFESWGTYSNYAFDVSRTVHVGEPSAEYARICATIFGRAAAGARCNHLRAGISTHDAWAAISKLAYAMPVPTPRKTLVFLHSIGLDIIELASGYPAFGRLKDFELEENTVVNFEYLYFGHSVAPVSPREQLSHYARRRRVPAHAATGTDRARMKLTVLA
jgi:Xaa-Pro aminopeptidase